MKRETLNILLEAAQQAPESPQLNRAVRLARKQLSKSPPPDAKPGLRYGAGEYEPRAGLHCGWFALAGGAARPGQAEGNVVAGVDGTKSEGVPVA